MCSKRWSSIQLVNDSQNGDTFDGNYCLKLRRRDFICIYNKLYEIDMYLTKNHLHVIFGYNDISLHIIIIFSHFLYYFTLFFTFVLLVFNII